MSHIALFMPSLEGGGAERMMVHLANAFAGRGMRVDLVLVNAIGTYREEVADEVRIVDLQAGRIIAALPGLVRYLRMRRPSALLSTLTFANIVAVWACRLVNDPPRLVLREANTVSAISRQSPTLKNRFIPHLIRRFYPWADKVVAVSRAACKDLVQTSDLPVGLTTTIYNPVVTDELFEKAKEPLSHPWFHANSAPVILGVGRLEPQKDFETLIRAFSQVRDEREAKLLILGEGRERRKLERLIRSHALQKDVEMPGFVNNPFKYMARADVFVLSSRFEGLPGVLIQALATGCRVVSTDCPSGPREILQNGRLAPMVPVGDYESMAEEVLKILESKRGSEKDPKIQERFGERQAIESYLRVLAD